MHPSGKSTASLHTPEELLMGAHALLQSNEPQFMRSVILESLSALEAYVQRTVFPLLDEKLDPLLVAWLKEKTKMDFDGRLKHLTPLALDTSVDVASNLWREYKEAREIRNKVVHEGRVATRTDAERVFETVQQWLSYLGSTVEVNISLVELKKYIESVSQQRNELPLDEHEVTRLITEYYEGTKPVIDARSEVHIKGRTADVILDFGKYKTIIEIKRLRRGAERGLAQLESLYADLLNPNHYRMVLVALTDSEVTTSHSPVISINDHTSLVYIKISEAS